MNNGTDLQVRKEIRERIARSPVVKSVELGSYMRCEKCNAPFEWLYIGGVGDHYHTILCEKCFHTHKGVPDHVIYALSGLQYGYSAEEAERRLTEANDHYMKTLAEMSDFS